MRSLVGLLGVAALGLVACDTSNRDFTELCEAASRIDPRADRSVEEQQLVLQRWYKQRSRSSRFVMAAASLGALPPSRRYGILRDSAAEAGAQGWSCPALEQLLSDPLWADFAIDSPVPVLRFDNKGRYHLGGQTFAGPRAAFFKEAAPACARQYPPLYTALNKLHTSSPPALAVVVAPSTPYRDLCVALETARAAGFRALRLSAADAPRSVRRLKGTAARGQGPGLGVAVLKSGFRMIGKGFSFKIGCGAAGESCAGKQPAEQLRWLASTVGKVLEKYGKGQVLHVVADHAVPARLVVAALGSVDATDPGGAVDKDGYPTMRMQLSDEQAFESYIGRPLSRIMGAFSGTRGP
jgi:hypothetical protein